MSNLIGQHNGNLAHRHKMFTDKGTFDNYPGVHGEVAFLLCSDYVVMALFNGVCPGGVARIKMNSGDIPLDNLLPPGVAPIPPEITDALNAMADDLQTLTGVVVDLQSEIEELKNELEANNNNGQGQDQNNQE